MIPFRAHVLGEIQLLKRQVEQLARQVDMLGGSGVEAIRQTEAKMSELTGKIDELVGKVDSQKTVIEGVTSLLQGLKEQIASAQGDLDTAGEFAAAAKLGEVIAAIDENTEKLARATASNTEANDEVHAAGM